MSQESSVAEGVKRSFDVLAAGLGLLVLSPLLLVLALAVRVTSRGPVLHRGVRIGRNGVAFEILKFRSMSVADQKDSPGITRAGDVRVTRLGRWLRRLKLDELPQLLNVLRGDMSLVGPRPEDPRFVALYDERQRAVLALRPGITSLASVRYRNEESQLGGQDWLRSYKETIMPAKLELDLEYVRRRSFALDLRIILDTVFARASGAEPNAEADRNARRVSR